mmetsp:Transcript_15234/g.21195  ORF Transcript_15234/g.21195 Transcript_15234/m.21195 type:complete len:284 (-) Transcript_15234:1255-2106(-)
MIVSSLILHPGITAVTAFSASAAKLPAAALCRQRGGLLQSRTKSLFSKQYIRTGSRHRHQFGGVSRLLYRFASSSTDAGGSFPTLEEVKKAGFEDSIAIGGLVSERLEDKKDDKMTKEVLQALLQKEAGARGFFVSFLTSENEDGSRTLADSNPPLPLISTALKEADNKVVGPLLVMNTVMPTAMVLAHRRNGNQDFAEMSQRVATRAQILLEDNPESLSLVKAAREAAVIKADAAADIASGEEQQDPEMPAYWAKFYEKYQYDSDMCSAISVALSNVISASS